MDCPDESPMSIDRYLFFNDVRYASLDLINSSPKLCFTIIGSRKRDLLLGCPSQSSAIRDGQQIDKLAEIVFYIWLFVEACG